MMIYVDRVDKALSILEGAMSLNRNERIQLAIMQVQSYGRITFWGQSEENKENISPNPSLETPSVKSSRFMRVGLGPPKRASPDMMPPEDDVTVPRASLSPLNHKQSEEPPKKLRTLRLGGQTYRILQVVGKGGSSKVYKVIRNEDIFALKRVSFKDADESTIAGYDNEIGMLRRFSDSPHIIRLIEAERSIDGKSLLLLMEYGEADLAELIRERTLTDGDNFLRFYWQQMLLAVRTVHEAKVVHCDLKPANFLLVRGRLKLIDFGISKAIRNDTTHIMRDKQVGTLNYMPPEALQEAPTTGSSEATIKIGRPGDVWALGCILYEMAFGQPPFAGFPTFVQRMHKITDPGYDIQYPSHPNPHLRSAIQGCLVRDPKQRLTIDQLLSHPFLQCSLPKDHVLVSLEQIENLLQRFAQRHPEIDPKSLAPLILAQWR